MELTWISNGQEPRYRLREHIILCGLVVPMGFESDGATIPKWARPFLSPMGEYAPAAFLHDYLLTQMSRDEARRYLAMAMDELEVEGWKQTIIIAGVFTYDVYKNARVQWLSR